MMDKGKVFVASQDGVVVIKLCGDVRLVISSSMDQYIEEVFASVETLKAVFVDTLEAQAIDSTSLGLLAKLALYCQKQFNLRPEILCADDSINKLFTSVGFDAIFTIRQAESYAEALELCEIQAEQDIDEQQVKQTVIAAHKTLMDLNEQNRETFQELVENLENDPS